MQKKLLIHTKLDKLLANVGDMALKARALNIVHGFDLSEGDRILDVGCGNGYYLYLLNNLGVKLTLTGIDQDKNALQSAEGLIDRKKIKIFKGGATRLPFKNSSFDKVLISEVIEHIEDEEKALSEIRRVLKPNGLLILTTCNIDYPFFWDPVNWLLQRLFKTHIKSGFWAGIWNQHIRLYKQDRLKNLLIKCNFKVEEIEPLTFWCIPFNHYFVNFMARLFYSKKLPKNISAGINKFGTGRQTTLTKIIFCVVNKIDSLNNLFPQKTGVSIFVKAIKVSA
ncbi:class I SAM-dependent methyltransferase [Candidatus Daviesbacteria bacterium]|nr:class I SAM-dependent methyltransferase [Candidatus Daviesbacteria bacterium]